MAPSARDIHRLIGVHPRLYAAIVNILHELPMFVVKGVRTAQEQARLYAQGRTTPGKIVTYRDGIRHKSNHQPHEDGFGYAVDLAFLGKTPFDDAHPWDIYGAKVETAGLIWGGRWSHLRDLPHAELPTTVSSPVSSQGANGDSKSA